MKYQYLAYIVLLPQVLISFYVNKIKSPSSPETREGEAFTAEKVLTFYFSNNKVTHSCGINSFRRITR